MGCFCQLFYPAASESMKVDYRERLAIRLGHIERHMAHREYMLGEHFSLADAYMFVVLNWSRAAAMDLSPFPNLLVLRKRVRGRPAVQEALRTEELHCLTSGRRQ
jgi:glutathione S-transferase